MIGLITHIEYEYDPREIVRIVKDDEEFLQYLASAGYIQNKTQILETLYDTLLQFERYGLKHHSEIIRDYIEAVNLEFLK